jgi:internalin A
LPETIGQLAQLQRLDLSRNILTELLETIGQLAQLQRLDLDGNRLTELPETIGQLAQLQHLNLANNELKTLPQSIGQLEQLQHLSLSYNQLTMLPASMRALRQLKRLFVARNNLTIFPESIIDLSDITVLSIGWNNIAQLPESIGCLQKLECLDLTNGGELVVNWVPDSEWNMIHFREKSRSGLKTLPRSLRNIGSLTQLYLHGNYKLGLPREVIGPRWNQVLRYHSSPPKPAKPSEILEYYFRVQSGRRALNEAKLILLGRGAVGKTSIVNRLIHDQFSQNERKTDGIQITEWQFRLNRDEDVRLNIWDFGGQEIMHATHQFFLTQRSLYLLVLNGREGGEDADAEYWLKLIESFGGDSPVILVLNKIKEHPFDVNRRALQQKYLSIRDFIKTDCEDGIGLEQLRKAIERETDRLEHLRDAFPTSWFTIKDRLAGMKKNYLSFDEYRKVCRRLGEKDSAAQEALAFYLHSLGIALNYKDDPRLQDTHVLNPHWVTNGIYKILNSDKLEKQKGEIWLRDLPKILDGRKYPAKMHRFLLDLMKKFDLCFGFADNDAHYLIPELLDKQEPADTVAFQPEKCLNFQYHYSVLPEGLLPRFIVRTHTLSELLPRWRTGVILKFENNRALVKADVQDKKVFISVSGPTSGRRQLLAIIRSDFERIHHDIRNLQPQEMIPLPGYPAEVVPYKELLVMEQTGRKQFPKVVDGQVLDLDIHRLLNGVDIEGTRRREGVVNERGQAVRLFYSYSHKDEHWRTQLETHLKLLHRRGLIDPWYDRNIEAGDEWKQRIDENLEHADIILLLVSADFIASDYCYEKEMKRAIERQERKEARVIPIIVRDVDWKDTPFAKLQALPKDGLAITKWSDKDSAWRNVSEGIKKVVEEIRKKPE